MIRFKTTILKFDRQGEKSGWTYVEIPAPVARKLNPSNRRSFRVKGKLDAHPVKFLSLLPMGDGSYILPLNNTLRKALGKKNGDQVLLNLEPDAAEFIFNKEFLDCLIDEPAAKNFFNSLPPSHQRYFSKWIDEAKTSTTRIKRISLAVTSLSRKLDFGAMLRWQKNQKSS